MGICSFSSPQPIGVSFRFRKCKFRNNSRNAIQHSAVDIWSGLPAPARDFHRARSPRLHASQWHPRVAKGSSDRSSARRPYPQVSQCHPRVAKGTSIDPLARGPSTESLLGQGHVARLSGTGVKPVSCRCLGRTSARHPRREASRWHHGVAKQSSIGSSSIKCRYSMDIEVRIEFLSMKCRCFMDVALTRPPGFSGDYFIPRISIPTS